MCPACGRPPEGGLKVCRACLDKGQRRAEARQGRGLCSHCRNRAVPGKTGCESCLARHRSSTARLNAKYKKAVFDHYGWSCRCCGCDTPEFLGIDHVHGGGTKHRKSLGGKSGTTFYRWLIKQGLPDGYQTLCHNCNMAKGFYGRCPHGDQDRARQTAGTLTVF